MRIGGITLVMIAALTSRASAGSDYRWHDRFFFGFEYGLPAHEVAEASEDLVSFGLEESYWANDYVGGRVAFETSDRSDDWGVELYLALPLRYIQLYAGGHLGVQNLEDMDTGVTHAVWPVVGVQAYLGRNGRWFVQWNNPQLLDEGEGVEQVRDSVVMTGLRWSPDWFHRARPVTKFDLVYTSALLTFVIWGLASVSQ